MCDRKRKIMIACPDRIAGLRDTDKVCEVSLHHMIIM